MFLTHNTITEIVIVIAIAFISVLFMVPRIIKYAVSHSMVDKPNERKVHKNPIPRIGGISFGSATVLIFSVFIMFMYDGSSLYMLAGLLLIFITGVFDDLHEMRARVKFFIQIVAAFIITSANIRIHNLWGIFGVHELSIFYQYLVSMLIIVGITNSFNLIDGIDGLAAGIGLINSLGLGTLSLMEGNLPLAVLNFSLAGGLMAFLLFNFNPARIFMGDSGSTVIGFIMGVSGVYLVSNTEYTHALNIPVILFGILLLPVFDTLRIFIERLARGLSPFTPEKNHIHHLLLETGFNHKKASVVLYAANIVLIFYAIGIQQYLGITASLITIKILGISLFEIMTIKNIIYSRSMRINYRYMMDDIKSENALIK